MTDITITYINETWMKVICKEVHQELDIQDKFSFKIQNAQHDPLVKKGVWDGVKKLYNRQTKKLYVGLLLDLLQLCHTKGWSFHVDEKLIPDLTDNLNDEDIQGLIEFINPHSDGIRIEPYDYQVEALKYQLNMNRSVCLAATSAGKSLILYMAVRCYQLMEDLVGKTIFITVPTIDLVEQLYDDFKDYSTFEGSEWNAASHCQKITGKYSKFIDKQIVITTWQSMDKLPYDVFEDIGAIFIDETHVAKASILKNLIESATSCSIRHGLTGTLNDSACDISVITGILGPVKRIVTAKELIDSGRASDVNITMCLLEHPTHSRELLYETKKKIDVKKRYNAEVEFINSLEYRREFIYNTIDSIKDQGNTLVIFDRVDSYGKQLFEEYKERHENTFLNVGEIDSKDRKEMRNSIEEYDDAVIFASFGTLSTGISIKKLHNMVIISSNKAKIRALQSIGRLMRLHSTKKSANILDLVDNLTYNDKPNYYMTHANVRLDFYKDEQFKLNFLRFNLK